LARAFFLGAGVFVLGALVFVVASAAPVSAATTRFLPARFAS
jgi:hypothetical protein